VCSSPVKKTAHEVKLLKNFGSHLLAPWQEGLVHCVEII
jgi:hypothetical protein